MSKTQKFSRYRLWCSGHGRHQIQETSQQLSFLSVLGLVTQERGEILKKKSQERKKRSCASPHFLYRLLKAEKQDLDGNDPKEEKPRKRRSDPREEVIKKKKEIKQEDKEMNDQTASTVAEEDQEVLNDFHYELCHKCNDSGELLLCDTCPFSFHLHCVQLSAVPEGTWFCPLCEEKAASIKIPTFDESEIVKIYEKLLDEKEKLLDDAFKIRTERDVIEKKLQQMQITKQLKDPSTFVEIMKMFETLTVKVITEYDNLVYLSSASPSVIVSEGKKILLDKIGLLSTSVRRPTVISRPEFLPCNNRRRCSGQYPDKEDEELSRKKEVEVSEKLLKEIDLFFMP